MAVKAGEGGGGGGAATNAARGQPRTKASSGEMYSVSAMVRTVFSIFFARKPAALTHCSSSSRSPMGVGGGHELEAAKVASSR